MLHGRWEAEFNSELMTFFSRKGLSLLELHSVGGECLRNGEMLLLPSSKGEGSEAGPMLDLLAAVLIAEASYQAEEDGGSQTRHNDEVTLSSLTSETLLSSKSEGGGVKWGRGGILPLLVFLEDTIPVFQPKSRINACLCLIQVLTKERDSAAATTTSSPVPTGDLPGMLRQTIRLCGAAAERSHSKVEGSGDDKEEARQWACALREAHAIIPAAFVPTAEFVGCQALCQSPHAVKEIMESIRLYPHLSGRHFDLAMLLILTQEANILEMCALPLLRGGTKQRAIIDSAIAGILTADPSPELLLSRTLSHGGCGSSSHSSGSDGLNVIESPSFTATSVPRGMRLLRIAERWMEFSPPSTQKQQTATAGTTTSSSGGPLQTSIILAVFDTVPEARPNILQMVLGGLTVSDSELGKHARQRYLRTWEAVSSASRIESLSPHTAVVAEALPGFFHIPIHSAMTAMKGCLRLAGIGNENGYILGGSHSSFAGAILSACRKSLVQTDTRGRVLAMHILASLAGTHTFSARQEAERAIITGLRASIPLPAKAAAYSAIGECSGITVALVNILRRRLVRYLSPPPPRLRKVRAGHSGVVLVPLRVIEIGESGKGGGCCARDSIGHLLQCVWRLEADNGCHTHLASTVLGTIPPDSLSSGTVSITAPHAGLEFASAVVEFLRCGAICRFMAESRVIELDVQETTEVKQDEDEERKELELEAEQCSPSLVKMPHRLALVAVLSDALVGCLTYGKFTCNWIAECQASLMLLCLCGLSCDALADCKCSNIVQSPPHTGAGGSLAKMDGKMSSQMAAETLLTLNQGLSASEALLLPPLLGCKAAMGLLRKWYLLQHMKAWNAEEEGNEGDVEDNPWVSIPEWVQWLGLERCATCLQLRLEQGGHSDIPESHAGKLLMAVHYTLSSTCCSSSEAQSKVDMDLILEEEKIDPFGSYFPPEFLPLVASSVLDSLIESKDGPKGIAVGT